MITPSTNAAQVIVVGGGLAGLAAALALGQHGRRVLVLEARRCLGGRAGSFLDPASGEWIDHCQHVSLGCCTNLAHFCRQLGIDHLFRRYRELTFIGPSGERSVLSASALPAPFHLLPSFLRSRLFNTQEKSEIARGLFQLCGRWRSGWLSGGRGQAAARLENCRNATSFADWLQRHGQSPRSIERFWSVILTSALSEQLERIDAAYARKVFVDAFLTHPKAWEMLVPAAPLGELYGERLIDELRWRNVEVRCGAAVERIDVTDGRVARLWLRDGQELAADGYVVAVTPDRLLTMLPRELADAEPYFSRLRQIEAAPITSVHLWYDRPIMHRPHVVVVGRTCQWIFRRFPPRSESVSRGVRGQGSGIRDQGYNPTFPDPRLPTPDPRLAGSSSSVPPTPGATAGLSSSVPPTPTAGPAGSQPKEHYYQVVISASHQESRWGKERLVDVVRKELEEIFPAARGAELLRARMVTEHSAVFSPRPGVDELRPTQASPIENLFLAGDWTRTGWPSTMEGAVRSGYLAAESLLSHLGCPTHILQPDLPTTLLARLILVRR